MNLRNPMISPRRYSLFCGGPSERRLAGACTWRGGGAPHTCDFDPGPRLASEAIRTLLGALPVRTRGAVAAMLFQGLMIAGGE